MHLFMNTLIHRYSYKQSTAPLYQSEYYYPANSCTLTIIKKRIFNKNKISNKILPTYRVLFVSFLYSFYNMTIEQLNNFLAKKYNTM